MNPGQVTGRKHRLKKSGNIRGAGKILERSRDAEGGERGEHNQKVTTEDPMGGEI